MLGALARLSDHQRKLPNAGPRLGPTAFRRAIHVGKPQQWLWKPTARFFPLLLWPPSSYAVAGGSAEHFSNSLFSASVNKAFRAVPLLTPAVPKHPGHLNGSEVKLRCFNSDSEEPAWDQLGSMRHGPSGNPRALDGHKDSVSLLGSCGTGVEQLESSLRRGSMTTAQSSPLRSAPWGPPSCGGA